MAAGDHESRISDLESRVDAVEGVAEAARVLSVAVDRDHSSIQTDVRSIKRMLAAHVQQTDERFSGLQNEMRAGMAEMRAGMGTIIERLDHLIDRDR